MKTRVSWSASSELLLSCTSCNADACIAYVSIRQHTSAYVSIRQHTDLHAASRTSASSSAAASARISDMTSVLAAAAEGGGTQARQRAAAPLSQCQFAIVGGVVRQEI